LPGSPPADHSEPLDYSSLIAAPYSVSLIIANP
jgi:hypothetical protein